MALSVYEEVILGEIKSIVEGMISTYTEVLDTMKETVNKLEKVGDPHLTKEGRALLLTFLNCENRLEVLDRDIMGCKAAIDYYTTKELLSGGGDYAV